MATLRISRQEHFTSPNWQTLLSEALTKPGLVSEAYSRFHNYSLGNQVLAFVQCWCRGIRPGPIATYPGWQALGRQVKRGEKALTLCMPVTSKRHIETTREDGQEEEREEIFTRFVFRNNWFVVSQTEGQEYQPEPLPQWDAERALTALGVRRETFTGTNGNIQGYARPGRVIAISPVAETPHKTLFHELGHVLLGHLEQGDLTDSESTPRNLMEVEAEAVALLCCESLGLSGSEFSRGYIQSWANGAASIPERSTQKIFHAAEQILKAGSGKSLPTS
jgi:antirestriction protein ArdC